MKWAWDAHTCHSVNCCFPGICENMHPQTLIRGMGEDLGLTLREMFKTNSGSEPPSILCGRCLSLLEGTVWKSSGIIRKRFKFPWMVFFFLENVTQVVLLSFSSACCVSVFETVSHVFLLAIPLIFFLVLHANTTRMTIPTKNNLKTKASKGCHFHLFEKNPWDFGRQFYPLRRTLGRLPSLLCVYASVTQEGIFLR